MLQNNSYPSHTSTSIRLEKLIKVSGERNFRERMSSRMVKCASVLDEGGFIGWQMIVPTKGLVDFSLFGSKGVEESDLKWIAEKTGSISAGKKQNTKETETSLTQLYEFYLPVSEAKTGTTIGFGVSTSTEESKALSMWPSAYVLQFHELVDTLRMSGAALRVMVGSVSAEEQQLCRTSVLRTYDANINFKDYVGNPVRTRVLLRFPSDYTPSARLKAILEEAVHGAKLRRIGAMDEPDVQDMWNSPLDKATVLPDYASRVMLLEPELRDTIVGIGICKEEVPQIPASHKNSKSKHFVTIGKAIDTSGIKRRITIGDMDLRRHYQIIGQTGTGKSTLLAGIILNAIQQGFGLTFFDPHGSTIDNVLQQIPEKYAERVRVVRIGDAEHPVPLNIWDSDDFEKEERTITDLCELFGEIFDPNREGFVGPRWERWFSTFAKASIALLGQRASLESIAVLSKCRDSMKQTALAIMDKYPDLANTIGLEYVNDKSSDFTNTLNWYLCKFQRLTSVEQLRRTLGAGTNALDFDHSIDTDTVTLIDLASPVIGTQAARIVGTLIMMKLWNAAMMRKDRDRTHMVLVDEASLFQTNPMPRMLAESRKFGISMVLCHQHTGQLTRDIRDALEANSANFSAFRLSPRDAATAAVRFDDPKMQVSLTRLNAFNAVTTLSVDGKQTDPFTLEIGRPKFLKDGKQIARKIEEQSIERLVRPYSHLKALTHSEIQDIVNKPEKREAFYRSQAKAKELNDRKASAYEFPDFDDLYADDFCDF